jgi:hypothetical protein
LVSTRFRSTIRFLLIVQSPKIEGVEKEKEDDVFEHGQKGIDALTEIRQSIFEVLKRIERE